MGEAIRAWECLHATDPGDGPCVECARERDLARQMREDWAKAEREREARIAAMTSTELLAALVDDVEDHCPSEDELHDLRSALTLVSVEMDQLRAQVRALTVARDEAVRVELEMRVYKAWLEGFVRGPDLRHGVNQLGRDALEEGAAARRGET